MKKKGAITKKIIIIVSCKKSLFFYEIFLIVSNLKINSKCKILFKWAFFGPPKVAQYKNKRWAEIIKIVKYCKEINFRKA